MYTGVLMTAAKPCVASLWSCEELRTVEAGSGGAIYTIVQDAISCSTTGEPHEPKH